MNDWHAILIGFAIISILLGVHKVAWHCGQQRAQRKLRNIRKALGL